jgi:hypothetical protein
MQCEVTQTITSRGKAAFVQQRLQHQLLQWFCLRYGASASMHHAMPCHQHLGWDTGIKQQQQSALRRSGRFKHQLAHFL